MTGVLALSLLSCGGTKGTLTVNLVTPEGSDPFAEAAMVHVTVGAPPIMDKSVSVSGGHFDLSIDFTPTKTPQMGPLVVQALASGGTVVGKGQSPSLTFRPVDESISVWVAKPERMEVLKATLGKARAGMTVAAVPRLGPMFVGGTISDGRGGMMAVPDVDLFDLYGVRIPVETATQSAVTPLPAARLGAVAFAYDRPSDATGVLMIVGGAGSQDVLLFDPTASGTTSGAWLPLGSDPSLARSGSTPCQLTGGQVLFTGGTDGNGAPIKTAVIINTSGTVSITAITSPMNSPRAGHTATPTTFNGSDGVLLFGGAGTTDMSAAESFLPGANLFTPYPLMGVGTRTAHTATILPDKRVVILGGKDASNVTLDSAVIVNTIGTASAQRMPKALTTARSGHTTTLIKDYLLVCGGTDATGQVLSSCEVLDAGTLAPRPTDAKLHSGRTGHVAIALETGVVMIAGGVDGGGTAQTSIELYTP